MILCGKDNKPFSIDNEIKKKVHGAKSEKQKRKTMRSHGLSLTEISVFYPLFTGILSMRA